MRTRKKSLLTINTLFSNAEIAHEDKQILIVSRSTYQHAIYFGPTVRFIEGIDLDNPAHLELLKSKLEIFVSDSIYRAVVRGDSLEIRDLRRRYTDIRGRIVNEGPFYGIGGCGTLDEAAKYGCAYGQSQKKGIYIGINTVPYDSDRVKIHANQIYSSLYGQFENPKSNEHEILHMYLGPDGNLLFRPSHEKLQSFVSDVAWVMDARNYKNGLIDKKPKNLLNPTEKINIEYWYESEVQKGQQQKKLFVDKLSLPRYKQVL